MFCASIIDAFAHLEPLVLNKLQLIIPASAGSPKFWAEKNAGLHVTRFELTSQETAHSHSSHHHSEHTTFAHIKNLIENSALEQSEKNIAVDILTILAKAEAKVHATPIENVHFHEVADWDSVMDIVAAACLIQAINLSGVSVSAIPLGGGLVKTQHGLLPVPAPAAAEILKGFTFEDDGIKGERVTPTGAAIIKYLVTHYPVRTLKNATSLQLGYGGGSKEFVGISNFLRAVFYDISAEENAHIKSDTVVVIEFDIDDMTGEEIAQSLDLIRQHKGVIDVTSSTARGKKNRAVECIRLLVKPESFAKIQAVCFEQTSTIGLRHCVMARAVLSRTQIQDDVSGENFNAKKCRRPNGEITTKIESDDLPTATTLTKRRAIKYRVEQMHTHVETDEKSTNGDA